MSRGYGRGSIVSFIVVGVLLVVAVLGGLYIVKNQLGGWLDGQSAQEVREVAREVTDSDDDTTTEESDDEADKTPEPTEPAPVPADDATNDSTEESSSPDVSEDATEDSVAPSNHEATTEVEDDDEASIPTAGVELPQTGIADSMLNALPIVALVAAVVAYRRSNLL